MSKEEQIRKDAIRIFVRKKTIEITWFLMIVLAIIFVPYYVGFFALKYLPEDEFSNLGMPIVSSYFFGAFITLLFVLIGFGVWSIFCETICLIKRWIRDNWEKSIEEARGKLE
jgi:hypothetical protein